MRTRGPTSKPRGKDLEVLFARNPHLYLAHVGTGTVSVIFNRAPPTAATHPQFHRDGCLAHSHFLRSPAPLLRCSYIEFYGYLCKALKAGDRPQISHKFAREHEQYTDLIRRCWATLPTERPSFDQIVTGFNRALNVGASGGKYAGFPGSSA